MEAVDQSKVMLAVLCKTALCVGWKKITSLRQLIEGSVLEMIYYFFWKK